VFDDPPAVLIIAEVRAALEVGLSPGFSQKVAANALGIALRELAARPPEAAQDEIGTLILATLAKLAVDQPGYPGYRALLAGAVSGESGA
jgi:hypothetical protein